MYYKGIIAIMLQIQLTYYLSDITNIFPYSQKFHIVYACVLAGTLNLQP